MWRTQIHSVFKIRGHAQMVGIRLVRSSSQIPGYPHIHIFAEPCSTSHETTDTLAGMTDGAQYSQTLHERSVLTANMCLEAQQRTTRPLAFALTTALDLLGIERPDEKTIALTNAAKLYVHVTASDLGDEEKERMLALRVASKIGQHLSQRVGIHERLYPSMALGFGTLIAGRVMGHFPPECRGPSPLVRTPFRKPPFAKYPAGPGTGSTRLSVCGIRLRIKQAD